MAKGTYNMVAVMRGGTINRQVKGAPTDAKMIEFGRRHGALAVVRFYPKYQAFLVLDIRNATQIEMAGVGKLWRGHRRAINKFETEDAAVMVALHTLV